MKTLCLKSLCIGIMLASIEVMATEAKADSSLATDLGLPASPQLNPPGISSAFISQGGDVFAYIVGFSYDNEGKMFSGNENIFTDGSTGVGFGLGSSINSVALELGLNYSSFSDSRSGFSVDAALGKTLLNDSYQEVAIAGGVRSLASVGLASSNGYTPFGVLSYQTKANKAKGIPRIRLNLGYGGGQYQGLENSYIFPDGIFGSIGLDLTRRVGFAAGWAGGLGQLTSSLSVVPFTTIPLTFSIGASNILQGNSQSAVPYISVTYGIR